MSTAAERWATQLAGWAIPQEILDAAPASPWTLPVDLFRRYAEAAPSRDAPSVRLALEALAEPGSVLDIGCGAGAASVPLVERGRASSVTGVDTSDEMLEAFSQQMLKRGIPHRVVHGAWPDAANTVEAADVVVCAHVLYNVGDIVGFVRALDARARRRVVIEMTERHPRAWLNPLWRTLHGLKRPEGPTADDAAEAILAAGTAVQLVRWEEPLPADDHDPLPPTRQMLCLGPERDDELRAALEEHPRPTVRRLAALWWDRS